MRFLNCEHVKLVSTVVQLDTMYSEYQYLVPYLPQFCSRMRVICRNMDHGNRLIMSGHYENDLYGGRDLTQI